MIQIAVVSQQGASVGRSIAAQFGPTGGSIGRAPTNTLVLDDPDRTVSRVHAQVLCRGAQYFVVDRGSNPLLPNGRALGAGNEAPSAHGDRLVIGGFELVVALQAEAEPAAALAAQVQMPAPSAASEGDDPFADLLAGLGPAPAPPAASAVPEGAQLFTNPMESQGRSRPADDDPFAGLGQGSAAPPSLAPAFDDLSDLGVPAPGKSTRIDDLFGAGSGGIGGDPLALSPLADPLLQPNTAAADDPLAALQSAPAVAAAPRSDHLPVAEFGFIPPKGMVPAPAPAPAVENDARFDDMTGEPIRIASSPARARPAAAPPAPAPADDPLAGLLGAEGDSILFEGMATPAIAPAPASIPVPAAPAASPAPAAPVQGLPASADADALLAAFLRGLGSTHQPPQTLTPLLMERIGSMLRSATEGTLQLLLTRQEFKREVRAEVTMIAAQANNPLKFSPTVEVALAHLLGPGVRGFMPAEAAMRDAFDDLRAHQFGVMVGMRAALAHVIARFGPEELEKKIAARSALDTLFAANRKAKLWDQFVALYGGIATEAEDDFHSLFGKAFLEAYEAQMARLKEHGSG